MPNTRRPPSVLIVNHDPDFIDVIQPLLESEGYAASSFVARGGQARPAYERVRELMPDILLLDLLLPETTGWTTLNLVKLDPTTTHIRVIVTSVAHQEVLAAQDWLRDRNCEILLRPFDLDDLVELIQRLLTRPPAQLTRRQAEIAALVARGLTNQQIARELVLSEGTVANHIARILERLDFQNRAQIASWVTEQRRWIGSGDDRRE